jgi:hypothetical protein
MGVKIFPNAHAFEFLDLDINSTPCEFAAGFAEGKRIHIFFYNPS